MIEAQEYARTTPFGVSLQFILEISSFNTAKMSHRGTIKNGELAMHMLEAAFEVATIYLSNSIDYRFSPVHLWHTVHSLDLKNHNL